MKHDPHKPAGGASKSEAPAAGDAKVVLVVDDDAATRGALEALLSRQGYRVASVPDGNKALERVAAKDIDLVLLDAVLPGLDGFDVCRLIKGTLGDEFLPVILLTARSDAESKVRGLRIGADDYVAKPYDERELLARVHAMLRIKGIHDEVRRAKEKLSSLAVQDELTGLYNFRYLHSRLEEEFKRSERYKEPLACLMIDLDDFKLINDSLGHDVGDLVLAEVGERLRASVREVDVAARYGGDEFLLILPSTNFSGAVTVADRVWHALSRRSFAAGAKQLKVTASVGVALYPGKDIDSKESLLKAADDALYGAKQAGRDGIGVFQHQNYIFHPGRH